MAIRSQVFGLEVAVKTSQIRSRIAGLDTGTFGLFL
jgi:hypothetical protein